MRWNETMISLVEVRRVVVLGRQGYWEAAASGGLGRIEVDVLLVGGPGALSILLR